MSNLFVVGYNDLATANEVRDRLLQMQKEEIIELDDVVVAENRDGKVKLHQARGTTGAGAAGGALWGGLIGLLFLAPLLGMAVGAGTGALSGKLTDIGVDDDFMQGMGATLAPGKAAVFALVRNSTPDKVIAGLARYDGRLLHSSLTAEAEQHLRDAVKAARRALAETT